MSLFGMFVGAAFSVIGVSVVLPQAGLFGIFWTLFAIGMTVYHAINVFSKEGIASFTIETQSDRFEPDAFAPLPFDEQLRKLSQLREEGLISEAEFQQKRSEVMSQKL